MDRKTAVRTDYDAVVVGSGPNGLAAAITLQQRGLSVLIIEGSKDVGGALRSAELTLPGFIHDVGSAVHPMAAASPFFNSIPLREHGLEFIYPAVAAAHPFDDGTAATLVSSLEDTARGLGADEKAYLRLMAPLVRDWPDLTPEVLAPLHFPAHPLKMAAFGLKAMVSATNLAQRFHKKEARGLLAGMAAHAVQPLTNPATAAFALVFLLTGHGKGWPLPRRGSVAIADALVSYFNSLGGKIETGTVIKDFSQLPSSRVLLLDMTPRQLLQLGGHRWSSLYKWQLEKYQYGMGVFKVDWALDERIPFTAAGCRQAGTVHIGNTIEEITAAEAFTSKGGHPDQPFVLLAQPTVFDPSRAPLGKHTAWAYCHVPNGSQQDMTEVIERQIERFAPGFRERILAKHVMNTGQLQQFNPNLIGGDIGGGKIDLRQLFTRPALRSSPYRTSEKGIYLCSSSTPPGGGVHGMCGYHAAQRALKDMF
jgi:phytoene dehydrogenase-like protein